jgi:stage III sporulation protein AA
MIMLIRAMSPRVIATDELGREEDIAALGEALNAGIKVLTTVHGRDLHELTQRPLFRNLMNQQIFERYVILSRNRGVGTLEDVIDGKTFKSLKR